MKHKKSPENIIIDVRKLSVERDTIILDAVDWRVRAGEHWVILGPNGSGKTSLLSALTGYLTPSSGSIAVCGKAYGHSDWRKLRECIGLVSPSVHDRIGNAEKSIDVVISGKYAAICYWGGTTAADRTAALSILRLVECLHIAERPWAYLSQGEKQRVLIGRALMSGMKLLILDEPCAGLDPLARESFLAFLDRLAGGKKNAPALVLVTHHVEEITPSFTHALVLKAGKVLAAGTITDVMNTAMLSRAFGATAILSRSGGRYSLAVKSRKNVVT